MSSSRRSRLFSFLSPSRKVLDPVTERFGRFTRRVTSLRVRSGPSLDDLPAELLMDTFEKLCWRDLLSVCMVSRRFRDLSAPLRLKTFKLRYEAPAHKHGVPKCKSCYNLHWHDRDSGRLNSAVYCGVTISDPGKPAEPLDPISRDAIDLARKVPPDASLVGAEELVVFFGKSWWQPWGPGFEDCMCGIGDSVAEIMASMPNLRTVRVHTVWWPDASGRSEGIAYVMRSVCSYCTTRGGIDVHVAMDVRDAGEFIGCSRYNWDASLTGLSSLSLTLPPYYSFTFLYGDFYARNPKLARTVNPGDVPETLHVRRLRLGPWQDDWLWGHDGDVEGPLKTVDHFRRIGFA